MTAALFGVLGGVGVVFSLCLSDMLRERGGLAVLLAAIAFFYPVFAVQAQAGLGVIAVHVAVFVAFGVLAAVGYKNGAHILAYGLVAHGVFDAVTALTGHPGPDWWPLFCGALDITAGALIFLLLQTRKIPR